MRHEKLVQGDDKYVLAHQVEQVYYSTYPCPKLNGWWVVYKTNPRERLFTQGLDDYQNEEHVDKGRKMNKSMGASRIYLTADQYLQVTFEPF